MTPWTSLYYWFYLFEKDLSMLAYLRKNNPLKKYVFIKYIYFINENTEIKCENSEMNIKRILREY